MSVTRGQPSQQLTQSTGQLDPLVSGIVGPSSQSMSAVAGDSPESCRRARSRWHGYGTGRKPRTGYHFSRGWVRWNGETTTRHLAVVGVAETAENERHDLAGGELIRVRYGETISARKRTEEKARRVLHSAAKLMDTRP
jgi:hypothetical protein